MAVPSLVQTKTSAANVGSTSLTAAFTNNVKEGNLIVVGTGVDTTGAAAITAPTDTLGNTYTQIFNSAFATNRGAAYYAYSIKSGANTVTGHYDGSNSEQSLIVREYWGVPISVVPLDTSNSATGTSNAPNSTATTATGASYRLVIGFVMDDNGAGQTYASSGYSNLTSITSNSGDGVAMVDKTIGTPSTETAAFTLGTSAGWVCAVATFLPSGGSFRIIGSRPAPFKPGIAL